jgi:predicted XRE-type DNA-binding protein
MSKNIFLDTNFADEDATVYALETDAAIAIARFIQTQFPNNQAGAARRLRIGQNEVSALLSGNIVRFSLAKLIRIARRAGLRLFLDMGDTADGSHATTRGRDAATIGVVSNTYLPGQALVVENAAIEIVATGGTAKTQVVKH